MDKQDISTATPRSRFLIEVDKKCINCELAKSMMIDNEFLFHCQVLDIFVDDRDFGCDRWVGTTKLQYLEKLNPSILAWDTSLKALQ